MPLFTLSCHLSLLLLALAWLAGALEGLADDWDHYLGPEGDLTWRETGIVDSFPEDGLPLVWSTPLGGGYGGPAVAQGRVFVMDRQAETVAAEVEGNPNFFRIQIPGRERLLCLRESDGNVLWTHSWDCTYTTAIPYANGPRCTPTVDGDRVYALGAEGHLWCVDAGSGKVRWAKDFKALYGLTTPTWGWSAHPLVVGDLLISMVGGQGSAVIAYNKFTGEERWRALSAEEIGYCPPMVRQQGGKARLIVWHGEAVAALDPSNGSTYWTVPYKATYGMAIGAPQLEGNALFLMSYQGKSAMIEIAEDGNAARIRWEGDFKRGLGGVMNTPFIEEGFVYGCGRRGTYRCVELATGERRWSTEDFALREGDSSRRTTGWANVFTVRHPPSGQCFLMNDWGELILARVTPSGFEERGRIEIIEPDQPVGRDRLVWSHPAFANRRIYCRNDREIRCLSLAKD